MPVFEQLQWREAEIEKPDDARRILLWSTAAGALSGHWHRDHWLGPAGAKDDVTHWSELPTGPHP